MSREIILSWLSELADGNPSSFHEYFYDDIRNFVINNEQWLWDKWDSLFSCTSKDDVLLWLQEASGYIVMELNTDLILENYLI